MRRSDRAGWRWLCAWAVLCWANGVVSRANEPVADVLPDGLYAVIDTPRGEITAELFYKKTPLAVMNFVGLAEGVFPASGGQPFYDGLTFHRIVPGFVAQAGDPSARAGAGLMHPFPDEFLPGLSHDDAGILSMANNGPDTNKSQFFFTLAPAVRLDYLHTIFGKIVHGRETLARIEPGDAMRRVRIVRIGTEALAYRADWEIFQKRLHETATHARATERGLSAPFFDDPDRLLPDEPPRAKAFNHKLSAFARITGREVFVRLFAKMPTAAEGARLSDYARDLAARLGIDKDGVLAIYVADRDEWKLWIGDELLPLLMGRPGTVELFMRDGALHQKKEQLLASAKARLARPGDSTEPPQQRLKLACDDLLASLIAALEPKPPKAGN